ncbi:hypothetical protein [Achromobacter xylosoxidans]|uniref:hypothetical protein n=1 Tax=Alcaligenes xylosoxydans xylosoxydans TaxID=85698 RepID=UPI000D19D793|nr:hypothetical protein [Achromobacter xylosoxidans]
MNDFIQKCISGDVLENEIDDFVDAWHEGDGEGLELHEYLGMTWEEYSIWATSPSILRYIIAARKRGTTLDKELDNQRFALAARAESGQEAKKITDWLKKIGKI